MKLLKFLFMVLLSSALFAVPGYSEEGQGAGSEASKPDFNFGLELGTVTIDGTNYTSIKLKPDLDLGKFGIGLDLNFEFDADWGLRTTEWTSWQAILAKITYIRYGKKKEAPVYAKIGGIDDFTLGHGQIMYQYDNTLNYPDVRKLGLAFDLDLKYAGFETMVDNIFDWDILGARIFGRPLIWMEIPIVKSLEIGATYVKDLDFLNAVNSNQSSPYDFQDNADSYPVGAWGMDLSVIVLRNFVVDMLAYFDFMAIEGQGTGEVLGVAGKIIKVIPYRLELQILQPHFVTAYFDKFYDANRVALYPSLDNLTNGTQGFLFSSGLSILEDKLAFLLTIQDAFGDAIKPALQFDFILHKDLLKKIGFKFSYYKSDIDTFAQIFQFEDQNSMLMTQLQYMVSDDLALTIDYKRTFELNAQGQVEAFSTTSISTSMTF